MGRKNHQIVERVTIGEMVAEGKCIVKVDGKVIFVEGLVPGDIADLKIISGKKRFDEAKAIKIHEYSSLRREPFCSHFGVCGGCKWQNLDYETQLKFKQQQVSDALERIGKVKVEEFLPIVPAPETQYYRNKLEYTFSNRKWLSTEEISSGQELSRNGLGFHIPKHFDKVVNVEHCYLQPEPSNQVRLFLNQLANEKNLAFFDLLEMKGLLRNLIIRTSNIGEVMVLVQFGANEPELIEDVMQAISAAFPSVNSLLYTINLKGNETFFDLPVHVYNGKDHIVETLEDLQFRIGPKSFYQTNSKQALTLYSIARDWADLMGNELIYDLYTGIGSIALFVAKKAAKVIGLEYIEMAVEDAKQNAIANGVSNAEFYAGDMKDILTEDFFALKGKPDVIITDPPRAGMHVDVTNRILHSGAKTIVYVSCNPATQARDLQILAEKYEVVKAQAVDLFPHTHHVESVALLKLKA